MEDRSLKLLRKKARKSMRGWPVATIAFYGPNLDQATKVAVGIVPFENAEIAEMRDWKVDHGDIRDRRRRSARDFGIHGQAWCAVRCDDGWHHRLSSPGRHRLQGRMVSGL